MCVVIIAPHKSALSGLAYKFIENPNLDIKRVVASEKLSQVTMIPTFTSSYIASENLMPPLGLTPLKTLLL